MKTPIIIIVCILFLLSGCNQKSCIEFEKVDICKEATVTYFVPVNYTGTLDYHVDINAEIITSFIELDNITEPYYTEPTCSIITAVYRCSRYS